MQAPIANKAKVGMRGSAPLFPGKESAWGDSNVLEDTPRILGDDTLGVPQIAVDHYSHATVITNS